MINNYRKNNLLIAAPAKINLHLEILGYRKDNFHELAMVMQSIDLKDLLSFSYRNDGSITLISDEKNLSLGDDNLIVKAAKILKKHSNNPLLGVEIHLTKNIPIGAGLAGGSADAAATLVGLNLLWDLQLSNNVLEDISSQLGSDVPFCILGGTQLCFGRGELLEPVTSSLTSFAIILVKDPSITISTPWAYSLNKQQNSSHYLTTDSQFELRRNILRNSEWLKFSSSSVIPPLYNDLQKVIEPINSSVRNSLKLLQSIPGSLSVAMSGSGPSCFAIFNNLNSAQEALEDNRTRFRSMGLDAWCCSLLNKGTYLD